MLVRKMRMLNKIASQLRNILFVPANFLDRKVQPILIQDITAAIKQICLTNPPDRIINLVGKDELSFKQLIHIMGKNFNKKYYIKEVSQRLCDVVVKYLISPLRPYIVNYEQYQLMLEDNVADLNDTTKILGKYPLATLGFWERELK